MEDKNHTPLNKSENGKKKPSKVVGKSEFARMYGVSTPTLMEKFLAIGINTGHRHTLWPEEIEQFIDRFGPPPGWQY